MHVARLALRDWRNYAEASLALPPAGLALVGDNGHGKTNVLEALYYLNLFRSVRAARDKELVRFGAAGFHIAAEVVDSPRGSERVAVGYEAASQRKKVVLDGVEAPRLSDAVGAVPSVLLSPDDVTLVRGAPAERRRYLDVALALTDRRYLLALQRYRQALAQRNAALRAMQGRPDDASLATAAAFEPTLATAGATLLAARQAWLEGAAPRYVALLEAIGERAPVRLALRRFGGATPDTDTDTLAALLAEALAAGRQTDARRGTTHAGPHRDDLQLLLDGRELRSYGSAGQQRSAALALRVLEAERLREGLGVAPLLLLDDPFAELDAGRAARILALLGDAGLGQVVLAVPRGEDVPRALGHLATVRVTAGTLTEPGT
ncbi:MAG: DNA replication and repair protein RecF [Gemmatimonadaceae bacterium]|nr:DNA replication and repair protein RecF [Gemmatimonadaceae bacterium]